MPAPELTLDCPAKVNLLLAITGVRDDGFHELVSVVTPLTFGDTLKVLFDADGTGADSLVCDVPGIPLDGNNLILKAAGLFRERTPVAGRFAFSLQKRIPHGAGLGGGSSDGASALRAMNELTGQPLAMNELAELAAQLGSDCPLFLEPGPVIMRGRGERVEKLTGAAARSLRGVKLLLFKPPFAIATGWAYGRMKARGDVYLDAGKIESELANWQQAPHWESFPLLNNMQIVAFEKFLALPTLLKQLREDFGLTCLMSGSGSCCFALIDDVPAEKLAQAREMISSAWGPYVFVAETQTC